MSEIKNPIVEAAKQTSAHRKLVEQSNKSLIDGMYRDSAFLRALDRGSASDEPPMPTSQRQTL